MIRIFGRELGVPSLGEVRRGARERAEEILAGFRHFLDHRPNPGGAVTRPPAVTHAESNGLRRKLPEALEARGIRYDRSRPPPFELVSYNTASSSPEYEANQKDFTQLPMYQKVIRGDADAPILALQEVGPAQYQQLERLAREGKFSLVRAQDETVRNGLLVIPKRFELVDASVQPLARSQVRGSLSELRSAVRERRSPNIGGITDIRMFAQARLRDRASGREFTVINTHLSCDPKIRLEQSRELAAAVRAAGTKDAVAFAGDLNLPSESTRPEDVAARKALADAGLTWRRPVGASSHGDIIDYVQLKGADSLDARFLPGPRRPGTNGPMSDHVPLSNWIQLR